MWTNSDLKFYLFAWSEFKQSRWYDLVKAIHSLVQFVIFVVFSYGLYTIVKALYPLLPKLAWLSIGLGNVVVVLALAVHFLGRYHERRIGEINAEREVERAALLSRAKQIQHLSEIAGRAGEIDFRYADGEIPEDVLSLWKGLLQTTLYDCYGMEGISKFYRRDDVSEISPARETSGLGHTIRGSQTLLQSRCKHSQSCIKRRIRSSNSPGCPVDHT